MDAPKDSPSEIAKQTLTRLTRERLMPLPENYCTTYRKVDGRDETWLSYCHYTKLLQEALVEVLDSWQQSDATVEAETARSAKELGQLVLTAATEDDLKRVREIGHGLGLRMKRNLTSSAALQGELMGVMQVVMDNFTAQAAEDLWLRNQLQAMEALLAGQVSLGNIGKAKELLQGLLERQQQMQQAMAESQRVLKEVMSELIRQVASLATDTSGFENKISELSEHVQAANDLPSIKGVVQELDVFVRDMGSAVRQSHAHMESSHSRLVEAELQIQDLRKNLAETSEKVRRDSLTGALNRSGLEEIWRREVEKARDAALPLSIGILDVDNFKQFNDQLGHLVGDEALVHLTGVIRQALHGTDTMARYGGEEFVILLPDTDIAGAKAVMRRLQRELTKHFFLHGSDRLLITFSAGVTQVDLDGDALISAIERADGALYKAKHQGKNRVVAA